MFWYLFIGIGICVCLCLCVCTPGGTEQQKLALLREATDEVGFFFLFLFRRGWRNFVSSLRIKFDSISTKTHNNNSYNNFNNNNNIIITIGARAAVLFSKYICLIYIYVFITHTHIWYGIHRDIFIKR